MTRRLNLVIFFLVFCASTSWARWDPKDKQYLEEQFRLLQDQITTLKTQLETQGTHLAELRQSQAQLQAVIIRQQRALQDIDQLLSSFRLGNEENFSNLKTALTQLRTEQQKAFSSLTGQSAQAGAGTVEVVPTPRPAAGLPAAPPTIQGYVTLVQGDMVTVDLGSGRGLHPGSRLALYKATDQNTRVGVLEVTEVVDAGNSRARIVTMNSGVRPDFSDIVRLE